MKNNQDSSQRERGRVLERFTNSSVDQMTGKRCAKSQMRGALLSAQLVEPPYLTCATPKLRLLVNQSPLSRGERIRTNNVFFVCFK